MRANTRKKYGIYLETRLRIGTVGVPMTRAPTSQPTFGSLVRGAEHSVSIAPTDDPAVIAALIVKDLVKILSQHAAHAVPNETEQRRAIEHLTTRFALQREQARIDVRSIMNAPKKPSLAQWLVDAKESGTTADDLWKYITARVIRVLLRQFPLAAIHKYAHNIRNASGSTGHANPELDKAVLRNGIADAIVTKDICDLIDLELEPKAKRLHLSYEEVTALRQTIVRSKPSHADLIERVLEVLIHLA